MLPKALRSLVSELSKLPGVGERTALRYSLYLLRSKNSAISGLVKSLDEVSAAVGTCSTCFYWTEEGRCPICEDAARNTNKLCVVRDAPDVLALEKFKRHPWKYHILQGLLSPLAGISPKQIRIDELLTRLREGQFAELILAFDATLEGDATALYLKQQMEEYGLKVIVSRTALGLPAGSSVEYLDPSTLEHALNHRYEIS